MTIISREDHIKFCKSRALEYVERGEVTGAFASMASDMVKHPETKGHPGLTLGIMSVMSGLLDGRDEMRAFIEGFN